MNEPDDGVEAQLRSVAEHAVAQSRSRSLRMDASPARRPQWRGALIGAACVVLLAAGVAVVAAGRDDEPGQLATAPSNTASASTASTTTSTPGEQITDAVSARAAWRAAGIDTYAFQYERRCFCAQYEVRITVLDDKVISAKALVEGASEDVADAPTIDSLLADARRAEASDNTGVVRIAYDLNGAPVSADIDWAKNGNDDEVQWTITDFQTAGAWPATATEAIERWDTLGVDDYSFRYERFCYCPAYEVEITVRNGEVVDVRPLDNESTADTDDAPTIDSLLADAQAAEESEDAGDVSVTYDPDGVPVHAELDRIENAVDDEISWTISDIRLGPS